MAFEPGSGKSSGKCAEVSAQMDMCGWSFIQDRRRERLFPPCIFWVRELMELECAPENREVPIFQAV